MELLASLNALLAIMGMILISKTLSVPSVMKSVKSVMDLNPQIANLARSIISK